MREGLTGHSLYSAANRRRLAHWVWTPPDARGPLPVVVLLHGVHDAGGFVWWQKGRVDLTAARLVSAGELPPFCLVLPGDTGAEQGSGYTDWHDGTTRAETYLVDELLPWIAGELPVSDERHIGGLSMGGYGALLLALRHPGLFRSASSTSGFFHPDRLFHFTPDATPRIWADPAAMQAHDVHDLVAEPARRAGLDIAFDCGTEDHLLQHNRDFSAHLRTLGVAHGYVESPGGHDWDYWARRAGEHLRFHLRGTGDLVHPRAADPAAAAAGRSE